MSQGSAVVGALDGQALFSVAPPASGNPSGFAAIGTDSFGLADYDNLKLADHNQGQIVINDYSKSTPLYYISDKHWEMIFNHREKNFF